MKTPQPCNQKHDPVVKCPDCRCAAETSAGLPRYAWILAAGLFLGVLVLLLAIQQCG